MYGLEIPTAASLFEFEALGFGFDIHSGQAFRVEDYVEICGFIGGPKVGLHPFLVIKLYRFCLR